MTVALQEIAKDIEVGKIDEARRALDGVDESREDTCDVLLLRGYLEEMSHDRERAMEVYDELLERDSENKQAMFRAALLADQAGRDEDAIALYEKCVSADPAPVNALINLALLCEEHGRMKDAEDYLQCVLTEYPNHKRAKQFLKSVRASYFTLVNEHVRRDREEYDVNLEVPISDFELSVRSRNCLRQMNIRTLGDLLRTTEAELLSYKNFGDTSLNEIKAMLAHRGLCLGQGLQKAETVWPSLPAGQPPAEAPPNLNKPVSELELSVRARKCLQILGVSTVGQLVMRSEPELMATKNFGQTSLAEIKRQLAQLGLSLRD